MKTKILLEAGYKQALFGMGLSHGVTEGMSIEDREVDWERLKQIAKKLGGKDGGHNKFLESMQVWIDITASLKFWDQFDTYRVGMTKQSDSVMHRSKGRFLEAKDCDSKVDQRVLDVVNEYIEKGMWEEAILNMPFGFQYRRIVCTNYKTLRNIYQQRIYHKWFEWELFTEACWEQLEYFNFMN